MSRFQKFKERTRGQTPQEVYNDTNTKCADTLMQMLNENFTKDDDVIEFLLWFTGGLAAAITSESEVELAKSVLSKRVARYFDVHREHMKICPHHTHGGS